MSGEGSSETAEFDASDLRTLSLGVLINDGAWITRINFDVNALKLAYRRRDIKLIHRSRVCDGVLLVSDTIYIF